jgi:hypothetical protein
MRTLEVRQPSPWVAGGIRIDYPMLQIICRATREDYPTARDKAENIRVLLASVLEQTISGVHIMRIEPMGSVNHVGSRSQVSTTNFGRISDV